MPRVIKNLNLSEVYIINDIDINIHDANAMALIEKEKPVMLALTPGWLNLTP
jgi:hypothetical protein